MFWVAATSAFENAGRGTIVVDTTIQPIPFELNLRKVDPDYARVRSECVSGGAATLSERHLVGKTERQTRRIVFL